MSRFIPIRIGLALPIVLISQAALADVTPAEVWGNWQQYLESVGYTISGNETANGDDLTVSDVEMSLVVPDGGGNVSLSMGTLTFLQNDDGSVAVVLPEEMPATIDIDPTEPGQEKVSMKMVYGQSGHALTVSGVPEELTYDYSADSINVSLSEIQVDGSSLDDGNASVNMTGTGMTSTTIVTDGDVRGYEQTGQIQNVTYDVAIDAPNEPTKTMIRGSVADIAFDGGGDIPQTQSTPGDISAMLQAGFAVVGTFTYGAGSMQINVEDEINGSFAANTSSDGGKLGVEMDAEALSYSGEQNNLQMSVQTSQLPFPVEASMAKGAFNLGMPIGVTEEPADFDFGMTLGDFSMSDLLWSVFDPTSQLPRDPATIKLDLSGKARMFVDLMDPVATAELGASAPGELNALNVNEILVDVAGARLEGSGDVTFDNTDLTTVPGMPKPVGAIDLSLSGANGLMDKLVAMGILPEEQAMGARLMMGLFAVAGDQPDTLNSKLEFTDDGQVLANGQRLR